LSGAFASVVGAADISSQHLAAIAGERLGITKELMHAMGDVTGLRKLELDALDSSNRSLKQQLFDLQDKQKANELAAQAAQQFADAWKSVTDSLLSETDRIRGVINSDGAQGWAATQSQFAITAAQARAGDLDAAKLLPQLSQSMLTLAEQNAGSAFELRQLREMTLASLNGAAVASPKQGRQLAGLAVGYPGNDHLLAISQALPMTPAVGKSGDTSQAELVAEIKKLNEKIQQLVTINARNEGNTKQTSDILDRVSGGGAVFLVENA
jgi:cell division protein FtsB